MTYCNSNPAVMTPREIDEQLQALYIRHGQVENRLASAAESLHWILDEKPQYYGRSSRKLWPTTTDEALAECRARGDVRVPRYAGDVTYAGEAAKYDAIQAELDAIEAEAEPFNAEFERRGGWPRFFMAQSHDGHYHSSRDCPTCNRGQYLTRFAWNPELSGLSEADALAELGKRAAVLCSVCFPSAPVAMFAKRPDPNKCAGGRYVEGTLRQWARSNSGQCPTCHEDGITVNADGRMRAHNKPKGSRSAARLDEPSGGTQMDDVGFEETANGYRATDGQVAWWQARDTCPSCGQVVSPKSSALGIHYYQCDCDGPVTWTRSA